jgi:hypothetical protein
VHGSPLTRLLPVRDPARFWSVRPADGGDQYYLCFHGSWAAYEVVVGLADNTPRTLPVVRFAKLAPRETVRLPVVPPHDGPWLQVSWRDRPRGGPRQARRAVVLARP